MKKLLIILVVIFLTFAKTASAATPTPTKPQPTITAKETIEKKLSDQINQLKEKIASRVSELNLVERRGMIGIVAEVSGNKIIVTDILGKTRYVDVDEITKFSSTSNKTFGLSDIKKGMRISVLGLYNKQSKRILARFINTTVDPIFLSGAIASIDTKNFQLVMVTPDGKQTKLDNQNTTKINSYDGTEELIKSGFSKLNIGDRITVIGFPDKKDPSLLVASRIVVLPTLPKNPKIIISEPTAVPTTATPVKTSAVKTPTPTKKP